MDYQSGLCLRRFFFCLLKPDDVMHAGLSARRDQSLSAHQRSGGNLTDAYRVLMLKVRSGMLHSVMLGESKHNKAGAWGCACGVPHGSVNRK